MCKYIFIYTSMNKFVYISVIKKLCLQIIVTNKMM